MDRTLMLMENFTPWGLSAPAPGLYIVNNYPVTKNKPIYHVRISKQMKGRAFSEPFHLLTVRA